MTRQNSAATLSDTFHEQTMMDRVKVAGEVTLDNPATNGVVTVLQLKFHRTNCVMHATLWPKSIRKAMKIALPNRFHHHKHSSLHNAIAQRRNTQRSLFAVGLRDVNTPCRLRSKAAIKKLRAQLLKAFIKLTFHPLFIYTVDARSSCTSRCESNTGGLLQP